MKLFNNYRAKTSDEEETKNMTNYLIQKKFDGELRQKMVHRLATDYGISQEEAEQKARIIKMPWLRWGIGLAAACLIGVLAWQNVGTSSNDYQATTRGYLAVHYQNNELRKGASDISLQRLKSVDAYNQGDFAASARYREVVTASAEATTEDFFFQGAAYLYQTPPQAKKAIAPLIRAGEDRTEELYEEARWHLALAYVETGQFDKARVLLEERIAGSGWNAGKAAELLKQLPKK